MCVRERTNDRKSERVNEVRVIVCRPSPLTQEQSSALPSGRPASKSVLDHPVLTVSQSSRQPLQLPRPEQINGALKEELNEIRALSIKKTYTPKEFEAKK